MVTFRIHLIRHGLAEDPDRVLCLGGGSDPALTPEGVQELRDLMETYQYPFAQKVYSSPLLRCTQTADLLFPDTLVETVDELRDCNLGEFEGKAFAEVKNDDKFLGWLEGKNPPPGGETSEQFGQRIACAFDDILHDMSKNHLTDVAVVTHGMVIMGLFAMCGYPRQEMSAWATDRGRGYTVRTSVQMWMHDSCFEIIGRQPFDEEKYPEEELSEEDREWNFIE